MTESARRPAASTASTSTRRRSCVIPHGAATPLDRQPDGRRSARRPAARLLTWGLLGPGKGIEWAIDAVAELGDLRPRPTYLIAGATHPKVRAHARRGLPRDADAPGLAARARRRSVTFDDTYRDLAALTELIRLGRPRGAALRLRRPGHLGRPRRRRRRRPPGRGDRLPPRRRAARPAAPGSSCPSATPAPWPTAIRGRAHRPRARRPRWPPRPAGWPPSCRGRRSPAATHELAERSSLRRSRRCRHDRPASRRSTTSSRMSDDIGTFEHADHVEPRREHGYCTDDMARVLVVVAREPRPGRGAADARPHGVPLPRRRPGRDRPDPQPADRPAAAGTGRRGVEDCWGRSVWAFGTAVAPRPRRVDAPDAPWPYFDRGARAALAVAAGDGLRRARCGRGARRRPAARRRARRCSPTPSTTIGPAGADADWPWPEPRLTYANAVLPEALLAAGDAARAARPGRRRPRRCCAGCSTARPSTATCRRRRSAAPGPATGRRRSTSSRSRSRRWPTPAPGPPRSPATASWHAGRRAAPSAGSLGDNDAGAVMWDPRTGGGYDGLHVDGANLNQGAESTLALIATLPARPRAGPVAGVTGRRPRPRRRPASGSCRTRPG